MKGRVYWLKRVNGRMGMRIMLGLIPILVVMVLWVTSKSSQFFLSTHLLFGTPHFIFSIFNSIILLITMRNHEPQPHEPFEIMELLLQSSPYHKPHHQDIEFRDDHEDTREEDDDGDGNIDQYDNRNEKEDEFNDEDEIEEWDEKEESEDKYNDDGNEEEEDEELEKRIEEFIAKVNKRWREEKLRDHLLIQICSSSNVSNTSN